MFIIKYFTDSIRGYSEDIIYEPQGVKMFVAQKVVSFELINNILLGDILEFLPET